MNTVLMLSGRQSNWNPMSGSFRKGIYPETKKPKPGDLVVFQDVGKDGANGSGHVTFFLAGEGSGIRVLGGNQRGNTGSTGAVCETVLPKQSNYQFFHSYRDVG